jgi:hypothetical protein
MPARKVPQGHSPLTICRSVVSSFWDGLEVLFSGAWGCRGRAGCRVSVSRRCWKPESPVRSGKDPHARNPDRNWAKRFLKS